MDTTEVIGSRLPKSEKRLVEALAARKETFVSHLVRDLLRREIREEMGEAVLDEAPYKRSEETT